MKRERLRAVHDHDLVRFLRSIGVHDDLVAGRIQCGFCGETATLESLAYVFPERDSITVSCNNPACVAKAALIPTQEAPEGR